MKKKSSKMQYESKNFELLRNDWPDLYDYANSAEANVHIDPSIVGFKLRCFVEHMTHELYTAANIPKQNSDDFYTQLNNPYFSSLIEPSILQKFNVIRIAGNRAVHCKSLSNQKATEILEEAFLLSLWFCRLFEKSINETAEFTIPAPNEASSIDLEDRNENLAAELSDARSELEQLQRKLLEERTTDSTEHAYPDPSFAERAKAATHGLELKSEQTRKSLKLIDSFTEYTLTKDQFDLIQQLQNFLNSNGDQVFILKGYAGTGKTFITKGLTEYFRSLGRPYALAAPTGKAAKVIQEKTGSEANTIHRTIYSLSDFIQYKEKQLDGSETFKYYSDISLNEDSADTVYIIDEASMISDEYNEAEFFRFGSGYLLRDLLKFVNLDNNDHNKKLILIGDDAQLPPVRMPSSPALESNYLATNYGIKPLGFELTEVVRQKANSGIMLNAMQLRSSIRKKEFNRLAIDLNHSDVNYLEHSDLLMKYVESCDNQINGESIVIAETNKDVADYNRDIRKHFFPGEEQVVAGDKVMSVKNSMVEGTLISNGDFGLVRKTSSKSESRTIRLRKRNDMTGEIEEKIVSLNFKELIIGFRQLGGTIINLKTLVLDNLLYSKDPNLSSDETKALYIDFCRRNPQLKPGSTEFKNTLLADPYFNALRLKFGYAITGHKAQGSEWNNVFIKCSSGTGTQRTSKYFKWLYTAITRAKNKVYLLDPPSFTPLTDVKFVNNPGMNSQDEYARNTGVAGSGPIESTDSVGLGTLADKLGIRESEKFRREIFRLVIDQLSETELTVIEALQRQYQESYTFQAGDLFAQVAIFYNGQSKITRIRALTHTDMSDDLVTLLSPLEGKLIVTNMNAKASIEEDQAQDLGEDFLNEHNALIQSRCDRHRIDLLSTVRKQWNLRYKFKREGEIAVIDIYFDSKGKFTKVNPMVSLSSSAQLLSEASSLLASDRSDDDE